MPTYPRTSRFPSSRLLSTFLTDPRGWLVAYTKQIWTEGAGGGTPIAAARLTHMEDGILDASARLDVVEGGAYLQPSPDGPAEVKLDLGDDRIGVLNWINNSEVPGTYLLRFATTANTEGGLIYLDVVGTGGGLSVINRDAGVGVTIQQTATVSSPTAYGFAVNQQSSVAPAMMFEQYLGGTAPAVKYVSYDTGPTTWLNQWFSASGEAGGVRASSGVLEWYKNVEVVAARIDAHDFATADNRSHTFLDTAGLEFSGYTGTSGVWWTSKIVRSADQLQFLMGATSTLGGGGSLEPVITLRAGGTGAKGLSFFSATPTAQRTGWATPTGTATKLSFDTVSVTVGQLAERVKAIIDDLRAYGLLG